MNIYIKWGFIVAFNTIFSLIFASDFMGTVSGVLGIIAGIACFILLYANLDLFLLNTKRKAWRKALLIGTIMMGVFSLHPVTSIISGSIALDMTTSILDLSSYDIKHNGFFPIFITTLFAGLVLSSIVLVLATLLRVFFLYNAKPAKTVVDND